MSWFEYGVPSKRSLRKNVWLRIRDLPSEILDEARNRMRPGEEIDWIIVKEIQKKNKVLLEFWCHVPGRQDYFSDSSHRFTVFYMSVLEDPNWVCEGDLGRGYKE